MKPEKSITPREALVLLTQYCSREERCIYDVKQKLQAFELSQNVIDEIIETLIIEKYVDETRYAKAFVNDKYRFNKWGKFKISFALKQKRIAESIISQALENIPENSYSEILNDELAKKLRSLPNSISDYEKRGRLYRFAAGRGFESDDIHEAINKLFHNNE